MYLHVYKYFTWVFVLISLLYQNLKETLKYYTKIEILFFSHSFLSLYHIPGGFVMSTINMISQYSKLLLFSIIFMPLFIFSFYCLIPKTILLCLFSFIHSGSLSSVILLKLYFLQVSYNGILF
jgi:hypothetical protein